MVQFLQLQKSITFSRIVQCGLALLLLQMLVACGPTQVRPAQAPVDDLAGHNTGVTGTPRKAPSERMMRGQRSAVRTLRNRAMEQKKQKKYASAAVLLERALQINPYDGQIWNNLAEVRYSQGRYELAESLAMRSNSYARGNRRLQAANWHLIAKTRSLRGDAVGAAEATKNANELR